MPSEPYVYAALGSLVCGITVLLIALNELKKSKRFHRKGVEHGSAKWGSDKEKEILADNNDWYNNVIYANDIFMVLDRKKREENMNYIKNKKIADKKAKYMEKYLEKWALSEKNRIEIERQLAEEKEKRKKTNKPLVMKVIQGFAAEANITMLSSLESIERIDFDNDKACKNYKLKDKYKKSKLFYIIGGNDYVEIYIENKSKEHELIAIKRDKKVIGKVPKMFNLNCLVIGGSGTGKSRFIVLPNLLQCNTSFVITDPSGELLQKSGKMLERNGYEVKAFNLLNMEHSSNYNPFHYVFDHTGRYRPEFVIKMINTFILNTRGDGTPSDPFWDEASKMFLSALCFFIVETEKPENCSFTKVLELISYEKVSDDRNSDDVSILGEIFNLRREAEPKALSVQYYDKFMSGAGKTLASVLLTTNTKLQYFQIPAVSNLIHKDNIHLEEMGDKKTALFIIIPTSDPTYNFMAAMMYTQLFDSLYDRAIQKHGGRLPVRVRFILDEFANSVTRS